ncbi:MAG: AAA family ATPase [Parvibaculaceae bacterium]|nr:AAA family ATPase [Parvibaculaceae bacterium]HBM88483.1 topology modulation protein [Rhodobiaceae bacterium]|tara:strand:+ start:171 stop:689 length:519 start_codon:yes stop_codon:yes gene_type:complete
MKRVLVIGPSGAGKTTLATALAEKTGLPLIHLDTEYWRPKWVPTLDEEWAPIVSDLVARDSWIIEGNFSSTFNLRMPRADTIILVIRPRLHCLWRVFLRYLKYRGETRPDLANGCPEKFDPAFYKWIWDFPNRSLPRIDEVMATIGAHASQITITSDTEARAFLDTINPKTN